MREPLAALTLFPSMSESSSDIRLERRGHRGRYVLDMPNGEPAELTFVESGAGHIIVDHTWVPPQYRGRGVAERLVTKVVEDAREAGISITPLCRFVATEFRRHKDWADVLKR
jgi:predicted GNAT family acetyltransferase